MSSNSFSSSQSNNSAWTPAQNKRFEKALALYARDTPDKWQKIARAVGKTAEEVQKRYQDLEDDVKRIENGPVTYPYNSSGNSS